MQNHSVNRRTSTQTLPSENCTLRFDLCLEITAIYRLPPRLSLCRLRLLGLRQILRRTRSDVHRLLLDVTGALLLLVLAGGRDRLSVVEALCSAQTRAHERYSCVKYTQELLS